MLATLSTSSGSGKEILVGDDKGWTMNFDYQAWANGKKLYVGDTLDSTWQIKDHKMATNKWDIIFLLAMLATLSTSPGSG
ncbi:hypothetical protein OSB04_010703 [Centaurea solstitialis]|uniref:Uncharacterized protein n=1 Tax=Centaurea solstitialis TaxID=347529 RepID=A0AA38T9S5_9ASTR|nr:hypothetical protein OSB04_010703 [Centaurea solstitialis]